MGLLVQVQKPVTVLGKGQYNADTVKFPDGSPVSWVDVYGDGGLLRFSLSRDIDVSSIVEDAKYHLLLDLRNQDNKLKGKIVGVKAVESK